MGIKNRTIIGTTLLTVIALLSLISGIFILASPSPVSATQYPTLKLTITSPANGTTITPNSDFQVCFTIVNQGPGTAYFVFYQISATGPVAVFQPTPFLPATLLPGQSTSGCVPARCTGTGIATITVTPTGRYCQSEGQNPEIRVCSAATLDGSMFNISPPNDYGCPIPSQNLIGDTITIRQEYPPKPKDTGSEATGQSYGYTWPYPRGTQIVYLAVNAQPEQVVANRSESEGNYTATLKINDNVVEVKKGTISGNKATPLEFTVARAEPGIYKVDVNGQLAYFTVVGNSSKAPFTVDNRIIIVAVLAVLVLVVVAVLIRHYAQR